MIIQLKLFPINAIAMISKKINSDKKEKSIVNMFYLVLETKNILADRGFDPRTSGLWAQHASTAPICCCSQPSQFLPIK